MKTVAIRRVFALCGYVAFLAAGPAAAQIGPIQPVLVLEGGKAEHSHNRPSLPDDYSVPIDVYVAADGTVSNVVVSDSTGNLDADRIAASFMRDQKFLPGLDMKGNPVSSTVRVTVNMFKRDARTNVGDLTRLDLTKRGVSGRLYRVTLTGSTGSKTVSADVFRSVYNTYRPSGTLSLRSNLLDTKPIAGS